MLRHYYINREWLLSDTARRTYLTAATSTLIFLVLLVSLHWITHISQGVLPWVKLLLLWGVVGTALTFVAMEYFLFTFDTSSAFTKAFWFCAMLLPLIGPPLYCFLIYSRAEPFRKTSPGNVRPRVPPAAAEHD